MKQSKPPVNVHDAYHAHIYCDATTAVQAKAFCDAIDTNFDLKVGRFHEKPVGPHPCWSCQVIFAAEDFDDFIAWLEEYRKGLTVLIHGLTGNNLKDHTDYAYWLGEEKQLNLSMFL
ncbi:MAG: DOPA 4,5-dioxygenase family protein [Nonlabens ulvanivorans]|uniref:DOPA 4,5-dioxygenase family protein n=1 Tax=Nonlabens ulvanivorans TaxID=906888 RepID=UPI003263A3DC